MRVVFFATNGTAPERWLHLVAGGDWGHPTKRTQGGKSLTVIFVGKLGESSVNVDWFPITTLCLLAVPLSGGYR